MLGVATMRATGARVGGTVRVTVADPGGTPHAARFHVIGRASLNAGSGGLGNGAVMTTSAFISVQCPAGPKQSACQASVKSGLGTEVLVRAAPGAAGSAALARVTGKYPALKALGFVRRQVAAAVCWQATTVALAGIAVGVPVGVAAGRVLWRVFATNFGVVPVDVVEPVLIAALALGVLAGANLLAAVPALLAARSQPARLLRAE
jgi:ABC-type lipoprotein release transport system permease subunit